MAKLVLVWKIEYDLPETCQCVEHPCPNMPSHLLDATNPDGVGDWLKTAYPKAKAVSLEMLDSHGSDDIIPLLDAGEYNLDGRKHRCHCDMCEQARRDGMS